MYRSDRTHLLAWLDEALPAMALGAALWVCCLPAILLVSGIFLELPVALAFAAVVLVTWVVVAAVWLRPPRPSRAG